MPNKASFRLYIVHASLHATSVIFKIESRTIVTVEIGINIVQDLRVAPYHI